MSNPDLQKNLNTPVKNYPLEIKTSPQKQQTPHRFAPINNQKQSPKKQDTINVADAKEKLDNLIEDLNDKLVQHFRMKEEALLNQYKQELIEQQKKLNELKNTTNEEQIRAKMLERKSQLERQRNHLIQTNMFFSQKCEQYKQTYSKLVQQSKDLEKQIQFLDKQIQAATTKRLNLLDEFGAVSERKVTNQLPIFTHKKTNGLPNVEGQSDKKEKSTLQKSYGTHSMRKIARSLHVGSQTKAKKSSSVKNFQRIDKAAFNRTTLEKIFQQSVQQVKNKRKNKGTLPNLKGEQFTQYEKRAIMEIFLGNQQVKRKLYEIIFTDGEKKFNRPQPSGQKVKISFDQLGI